MKRSKIAFDEFNLNIFKAWEKDWFLLTAGDLQAASYNPMTVAWGSFGVMWAKPFAQIVVRPSRFTHHLTETHDSFTLCAFPEEYNEMLTYCGTTSGRDADKTKESNLTPIPSSRVAAPGFDEAELIIECKKMYRHCFEPGQFMNPSIESCYEGSDYHTVYYGEILAINGIAKYRCRS